MLMMIHHQIDGRFYGVGVLYHKYDCFFKKNETGEK